MTPPRLALLALLAAASPALSNPGAPTQQHSVDDKGQTPNAQEPGKQAESRAETVQNILAKKGKTEPLPERFVQKLEKMNPERFNGFVEFLQNGKKNGGSPNHETASWWERAWDPKGNFGRRHHRDDDGEGGPVTGGPGVNKIDRNSLQGIPSGHPLRDSAEVTMASQDQNRGKHAEALRGYEGVISRGNAGPETYAYASLSALNIGEPHKAVTYSLKSLEMDPTGPMAEQATAINKLASKRVPKEEDPKAPIRGSDPQAPAAPTRAPSPTKASAAADSIPELDRPLQPRAAAAGLPPEALAVVADTNRLMALASKAYRANDLKEALKLSAETLAKDPDDVRALQVSAAAHAKEGKWEEVRKEADRGLDLAPGYVPLLLLRSASAIHVKDWRAAKADAAAVLAKEKANPTAWRFMGIAQSGLGEREEAVTSLARAQQYGDPEARRLLALARSLPPGADAADLVEMLANAADGLETAAAARAAAPPPRARGLKTAVVFAAAVLTGVVVGGLIFLAGRPETESS